MNTKEKKTSEIFEGPNSSLRKTFDEAVRDTKPTHKEKIGGWKEDDSPYRKALAELSVVALENIVKHNSDEFASRIIKARNNVDKEVEKLLTTYTLSLTKERVAKLEGMNGCRFGCFCKLCELCNQPDTAIHCGDCVMQKPVSIKQTLIDQEQELIEGLEKGL